MFLGNILIVRFHAVCVIAPVAVFIFPSKGNLHSFFNISRNPAYQHRALVYRQVLEYS